MNDKPYAPAGPERLSLPAEAADKLITAGDGGAALLYIFLLRTGCPAARADAKALGMSQTELDRASGVLLGLGLLPQADKLPPADELPEYSAEDIASLSRENQGFTAVLDDTARIYGRRLSTQETKTLFGLYDYLGLPPEVILLLVNHCVSRYREKNGPGRLPSMRSVEKEAFVWANREILTLEQAEAHIEGLAARRDVIGRTRQLLGLRDRPLSPSERRYVDAWLDLGFSPESIAVAYDRTVLQKGALVWAYLNGILRHWHEKGLHTPEEIDAGDGRRAEPEGGPRRDPPPKGGDLARMKQIYDRVKNR